MTKYFYFQIVQSAMRPKSKLVENAISVSAEKVMGSILKFNPGFGSRYRISVAHYQQLSETTNCWYII